MVCQFCKSKEATVHVTEIADNKVKKVDACAACAKEKNYNDPAAFAIADHLLGLGASQIILLDQAIRPFQGGGWSGGAGGELLADAFKRLPCGLQFLIPHVRIGKLPGDPLLTVAELQ